MSQDSVERRIAPRYTVVMDAQVTDLLSRSIVKVRCSDVSLSGCYLDTLNPMDPGTPIWVRLEHAMHVFEAQAKVAYMVPRLGMGVAFAEPLAADQLLVLSEWIRQAASVAKPQPFLFGASSASR
jgi:hypothetical protein